MTANLPEFRRRRRLDDVLTTLRMPRRFARENFISGRRRCPISSSMLKVPIKIRRTPQNQQDNFARASRFFVHFSAVTARLRLENA